MNTLGAEASVRSVELVLTRGVRGIGGDTLRFNVKKGGEWSVKREDEILVARIDGMHLKHILNTCNYHFVGGGAGYVKRYLQ